VDKPQGKNDLNTAVPKFCLAVEEYRRSPEGRVRTSQEFLGHFFPHDEKGSTDQLFLHLPMDVRGPILSSWGIRGLKAALRDSDAKVESVVYDALLAGDIDHAAFEQGLTPETVVRWVPLTSWWQFWRGGKLSKKAIHKALETAFDVGLFDAKWFLEALEGRGGKLRGTDAISEGLTKADLTDWVKKIHQSGDGSPKGIVLAIGWEKIVTQTANEILIAVLDALANKVNLAGTPNSEAKRTTDRPTGEPDGKVTGAPGATAGGAPPTKKPADALNDITIPIDTDGPELQVGETEVSSLTEEGMMVDIDDDGPIVATSAKSSPSTPLSMTAASIKRVTPAASQNDEEELDEKTEVFKSEIPRGRAR
jgi:hypothetical protein